MLTHHALQQAGAGDVEESPTTMAIANISQVPMIGPGGIQSEEWIQSLPMIILFIFLFIFYALLVTYEYVVSNQQVWTPLFHELSIEKTHV